MSNVEQRIQQLLTLLKIKEADKQAALKDLAEARKQFNHLRGQLERMLQYRQEYQSQIASIGEAGCNINRMRNRLLFIEQLDEGIKQLNHQLSVIAKQRKQCELVLIEKQKKVQSVEKLIEARKKSAIIAENRLEQKENDEYASKQWYNDNS
ncbi:flagellar export protein FliJ [Legionella sp. W05-934-2]|jgi:flagellar FliJ protein|uniref:flagellar export protein FliJ n=1 Tax=Legionella sp. W05-934-2 TaxID=1198649 RepID=UPI003461D8F8